MLVLSDGANDVAPLSFVESARTDVDVLALYGADHFVDGDAAGGEGSGVDDDLQFALKSAEDVTLGHTGHAFHRGFDDVLGEVEITLNVQLVVAGQRVEDHPGDGAGAFAAAAGEDGTLGVEGVPADLLEFV